MYVYFHPLEFLQMNKKLNSVCSLVYLHELLTNQILLFNFETATKNLDISSRVGID